MAGELSSRQSTSTTGFGARSFPGRAGYDASRPALAEHLKLEVGPSWRRRRPAQGHPAGGRLSAQAAGLTLSSRRNSDTGNPGGRGPDHRGGRGFRRRGGGGGGIYWSVGWAEARPIPATRVARAQPRHKSLGESHPDCRRRDSTNCWRHEDEVLSPRCVGGRRGLETVETSDRAQSGSWKVAVGSTRRRGLQGRGHARGRSQMLKLQGMDFSGADLSGGEFESPVTASSTAHTMRGEESLAEPELSFRDVDFGNGMSTSRGLEVRGRPDCRRIVHGSCPRNR